LNPANRILRNLIIISSTGATTLSITTLRTTTITRIINNNTHHSEFPKCRYAGCLLGGIIAALSINNAQNCSIRHNDSEHNVIFSVAFYAVCVIMLSVSVPRFVMLSVIMLKFKMLSVIMLKFKMLSVIMLSVIMQVS
jgi:hypothetical protein